MCNPKCKCEWFNENGGLLNLEQIIKSEFRLRRKDSHVFINRGTYYPPTDPSDFKKINILSVLELVNF